MAASIGRRAPDAASGSTASRGASTSTAGHAALDIDALAKSIEQDILKQKQSANLWPGPSPRTLVTISKVDEQTRAVGEDEYTPHDVSIGPYHRGHLPSQRRTDEEKLRLLRNVLGDVFIRRGERVVLRDLLEEMEKLEGWKYYAHRSCGMDREEFARMLLFDGCYLLGYIVKDLNWVDQPAVVAPDSPTRSAAGGGSKDEIVVRDCIYLLENQIPFPVLERIYEHITGQTGGDVLRNKLAEFVQPLLWERFYIGETPANSTQPQPQPQPPPPPPPPLPHHLLHLMHQQFVSPAPEKNSHIAQTQKKDGTGRWRRATEYCSRANVRFERLVFSADVRSVLDVNLVGGTLQMPRLRIDTNTWTILRNLMALEQLLRQTSASPDTTTEPRVTAYCLFMSQVACTAEDVELLGRAGVVEHFLGSDAEAAAGFANLCKGVVLDVDDRNSNYLKPTWHDLEWRYRSRKHNLVAWFRQTHCRNQCYAAAFVVAVILFACAVLQVVFAGMDYGKK